MATRTPISERLAELLADEATGQLGVDERAELDRLRVSLPADERESYSEQFMSAAGIAQVAFLQRDGTPARAMPAALRDKLARQGTVWQSGRQVSASVVADFESARQRRDEQLRRPVQSAPDSRSLRGRFSNFGWYTAAALALVFVATQLTRTPTPRALAPLAARAELLEKAPDTIRIAWGTKEPGFEGVSGDVVWSSARQEGYMRFAGLPKNDSSREQYQLWVVDPDRDARPVDGGVFDVGSNGEIVIPIDAKLRVGKPAAFAITLEKPGGVVVSDGPLLVVAAVET